VALNTLPCLVPSDSCVSLSGWQSHKGAPCVATPAVSRVLLPVELRPLCPLCNLLSHRCLPPLSPLSAAAAVCPYVCVVCCCQALRKQYACTLPIEIAYRGDKEIDPVTRQTLTQEFAPLHWLDLEQQQYPAHHFR
jgi:hypothetical protein